MRTQDPMCHLSDFHKHTALADTVDVRTHRTLRIGNHLLQICNKGARIGSTKIVLVFATGELNVHLLTIHAQSRDGSAIDIKVTHDVV